MITESQLRRIDELRGDKEKVESLLRSFSSKHVWARVGIVDINGAATRDPRPSDHARFFHTEMKNLVDELSDVVIQKLKHKSKAIDLELSQYVAKED